MKVLWLPSDFPDLQDELADATDVPLLRALPPPIEPPIMSESPAHSVEMERET